MQHHLPSRVSCILYSMEVYNETALARIVVQSHHCQNTLVCCGFPTSFLPNNHTCQMWLLSTGIINFLILFHARRAQERETCYDPCRSIMLRFQNWTEADFGGFEVEAFHFSEEKPSHDRMRQSGSWLNVYRRLSSCLVIQQLLHCFRKLPKDSSAVWHNSDQTREKTGERWPILGFKEFFNSCLTFPALMKSISFSLNSKDN